MEEKQTKSQEVQGMQSKEDSLLRSHLVGHTDGPERVCTALYIGTRLPLLTNLENGHDRD